MEKKVTWVDIYDQAIANIGLTPDEFENMTWANYQRVLFYKSKEDAGQWDKVRVVLSYILNTSVTKKSDQRKPKDIIPLWTDRLHLLLKRPPRIPTEQEKKEMLERIGK
jgi:hypothetical protein